MVPVRQTSIINAKGQVTIPVAMRRALGLQRGDEVAFALDNGYLMLVPVDTDTDPAFGVVKSGRSVTLDDMEAAIRKRSMK